MSGSPTGSGHFIFFLLKLPPNHFIHHAGVGLDQLDYLGRNIFFDIIGDGDAEVTGFVHGNCGI